MRRSNSTPRCGSDAPSIPRPGRKTASRSPAARRWAPSGVGQGRGRQASFFAVTGQTLRHQPAHADAHQAAEDHLADLVEPALDAGQLRVCSIPAAITIAAVIGACRHMVWTWMR